jgi:aspartate aminotransferase
LKEEWQKEIELMRLRIVACRHKLALALKKKDFFYLNRQKGMFSLLGLNVEKVVLLKQKFALYLPDSSRINMAGLSDKNLAYVVKAIEAVL